MKNFYQEAKIFITSKGLFILEDKIIAMVNYSFCMR